MENNYWQAVIERATGESRNGKPLFQYVMLGYDPQDGILKDDLVVGTGAKTGLPIYTLEELERIGGLDEDVIDYIDHKLTQAPHVLELQPWWKRISNRFRLRF